MTLALKPVARARMIRDLSDLDFKRALVAEINSGTTQQEVARSARMSQAAISQHLKNARTIDFPKPGFSGSTPLEVCERYAAGQISREQAKEELVVWPYLPIPEPENFFDDGGPVPPGTWDDVIIAADRGYIDEALYSEILEEHDARGL